MRDHLRLDQGGPNFHHWHHETQTLSHRCKSGHRPHLRLEEQRDYLTALVLVAVGQQRV